ncbi:MAG: lipid-A-disaccharide synthase [Alphaproteobacteria bacterium]|nr:lipid-A-disaccharide synthase [Alphaproteobacteria bacterium]
MDKSPLIYLIAGEPSGDALGANLMRALDTRYQGRVRFAGIGGDKMTGQGLRSLFPMSELSIMGIAEVIPKIPHMLKRISLTVQDIQEKRPDMVITIDSPDFSFRVARALKKAGSSIPRVHYVAPSVWAWRAGRAKKIADIYNGLLCFFEFEVPYFERHGLRTKAIGHPVIESGVMAAQGFGFKQRYHIERPTLGVFFGSRAGEIERLSPVLIEVMQRFRDECAFIIPTLPHLQEHLEVLTSSFRPHVHVVSNPAEKWQAFKACDKAVAVSGTVGLELAVAGVPHVIAYRMNPLTWVILQRVSRVKHAHLVNILKGKTVIPEFLQDHCTADEIERGLRSLTPHVPQADITHELGTHPSDKAAEFIEQMIPI